MLMGVNNDLIFMINNTFNELEFFIPLQMLIAWTLLESNTNQGMFLLGFKAKVPLHFTEVEMSCGDGSESCHNASDVPA